MMGTRGIYLVSRRISRCFYAWSSIDRVNHNGVTEGFDFPWRSNYLPRQELGCYQIVVQGLGKSIMCGGEK